MSWNDNTSIIDCLVLVHDLTISREVCRNKEEKEGCKQILTINQKESNSRA